MGRKRGDGGRFIEKTSPTDVLGVLEDRNGPVTGKEVGDEIGISNRSALDKLNELHEEETVERKKVGGGAVVWWLRDEYAGQVPNEVAAVPSDNRAAVEERDAAAIIENLETFIERGNAPESPLPSAETVSDDYHAHRHRENLERLAREGE
jgi:predicted ArsR family transcriptional regulator